MKIVLRGGFSDMTDTRSSSFWYKYKKRVEGWINEGKSVAVVTLAKPDGYYQEQLDMWPNDVNEINSKTLKVKWDKFDVIILAGGYPKALLDALKKRKFSLDKLKKSVFILGDSAGAYILSSYFYDTPPGEDRGKTIEFLKGFNLKGKIITVAHANNPKYTNSLLLKKVQKFAKEKGLKVLMLEENEEKVI